MNVVRTLNAFPVWTFDIWRGHRDEACGAAWWLAFGIALLFALRTPGFRLWGADSQGEGGGAFRPLGPGFGASCICSLT